MAGLGMSEGRPMSLNADRYLGYRRRTAFRMNFQPLPDWTSWLSDCMHLSCRLYQIRVHIIFCRRRDQIWAYCYDLVFLSAAIPSTSAYMIAGGASRRSVLAAPMGAGGSTPEPGATLEDFRERFPAAAQRPLSGRQELTSKS